MQLAHLFDYDNVLINKAEVMVDRLIEILGISEIHAANVRDNLINQASIYMLLHLVKQLPKEKREWAVEQINHNLGADFLVEFKKNFTDKELEESFRTSIKYIFNEKLNGMKSAINMDQVADIERLIEMVDKF